MAIIDNANSAASSSTPRPVPFECTRPAPSKRSAAASGKRPTNNSRCEASDRKRSRTAVAVRTIAKTVRVTPSGPPETSAERESAEGYASIGQHVANNAQPTMAASRTDARPVSELRRRTRTARLATSTTYAPIRKPSATRRYVTSPDVAKRVRAASLATTTPVPSTIPIQLPDRPRRTTAWTMTVQTSASTPR